MRAGPPTGRARATGAVASVVGSAGVAWPTFKGRRGGAPGDGGSRTAIALGVPALGVLSIGYLLVGSLRGRGSAVAGRVSLTDALREHEDTVVTAVTMFFLAGVAHRLLRSTAYFAPVLIWGTAGFVVVTAIRDDGHRVVAYGEIPGCAEAESYPGCECLLVMPVREQDRGRLRPLPFGPPTPKLHQVPRVLVVARPLLGLGCAVAPFRRLANRTLGCNSNHHDGVVRLGHFVRVFHTRHVAVIVFKRPLRDWTLSGRHGGNP